MSYNTIKIKKYSDIIEEYKSTAVEITPGMFLELASATTVQAHSGAGENILQMVALEDELQGKEIDDNYAVSTRIQCWIPGRGDIVYALLKDGEKIAVGDFVESDGAGYVQKYAVDIDSESDVTTIYSNQIIGQAIEAVDMSEASSIDPSDRIQIRII
jgi:hypothetical protein